MRHTFIMTESGETSFWSNHIQPHGFTKVTGGSYFHEFADKRRVDSGASILS